MDKEVEKLSRLAKQYKRRAAQDPVERWPDLLKVKFRAKQSKAELISFKIRRIYIGNKSPCPGKPLLVRVNFSAILL